MSRKLLRIVHADAPAQLIEVDGWTVEKGVLHTWLEQYNDIGQLDGTFGDVWWSLAFVKRWYWEHP